MRKNFGKKPYLYPMPVLVVAAYGENDVPNAMPAAWGCLADMDRVAIFIGAEHKTTENILARKAFTVGLTNAENLVPADYLGIVSGNKVPNKVEKTGWHLVKSAFVDAPVVEELPLTLECRMISYDKELELLIGEIVNVGAEESVLTDGRIDLEKVRPISYDPVANGYYAMGERLGKAFHDGGKLK